MPSNRTSNYAIARILDLYSLGEEVSSRPLLATTVDIVISDNSGDPNKWKTINGFIRPKPVRVIRQHICSAADHLQLLFDHLNSDYYMFIADDDKISIQGLLELSERVCQFTDSPSPASFTGLYMLETNARLSIYEPRGIGDLTALARLEGWMAHYGPNVLFYSAIRKDIWDRFRSFCSLHPIPFSFHDQIFTLMIIQAGKVVSTSNVIYSYNMANWSTDAIARETDSRFVVAAGLDESLESLQWAFGALEGALMSLSSTYSCLDPKESQLFALRWFGFKFNAFRVGNRLPKGSNAALIRLINEFSTSYRAKTEIDIFRFLKDIASLLAESNPSIAKQYYQFWMSAIGSQPFDIANNEKQ